MENGKKSKILVVAFILGIGFLFLWGLATYNNLPLTKRGYEAFVAMNALEYASSYEDYKKNVEDAGLSLNTGSFWWALTSLIISVPAILLNFFGWFKNVAKNILVAAILYLVTLNIPSAVLCFICFRKLKKPA
jgi:hypothetical protein